MQMHTTSQMLVIASDQGPNAFEKMRQQLRSELIEKKCDKLAHGLLCHEEIRSVTQPLHDGEDIQRTIIDRVEKVQLAHDRFLDELERIVSNLRAHAHSATKRKDCEHLLTEIREVFDALEAVCIFSVANYIILRDVCEEMEESKGFKAEACLSDFVNCKRFVQNVEGGLCGCWQTHKMSNDLALLFSEVQSRWAGSSLLGRIVGSRRNHSARV
mmetsp:Transcript_12416/g.25561  ORF Transcript_12416/g.25561 Transcript_12416/m.25561 type:complete len:214 (+) Transcript_12416:25-666(+)